MNTVFSHKNSYKIDGYGWSDKIDFYPSEKVVDELYFKKGLHSENHKIKIEKDGNIIYRYSECDDIYVKIDTSPLYDKDQNLKGYMLSTSDPSKEVLKPTYYGDNVCHTISYGYDFYLLCGFPIIRTQSDCSYGIRSHTKVFKNLDYDFDRDGRRGSEVFLYSPKGDKYMNNDEYHWENKFYEISYISPNTPYFKKDCTPLDFDYNKYNDNRKRFIKKISKLDGTKHPILGEMWGIDEDEVNRLFDVNVDNYAGYLQTTVANVKRGNLDISRLLSNRLKTNIQLKKEYDKRNKY